MPIAQSKDRIQADFDRIALLPDKNWDHNTHYHPFLLKGVPKRCQTSLEIGCGKGTFAHLLAKRSEQVIAIDLSPQMIQIAKARYAQYSNIDFRVADAETWDFPNEHFDSIVSIAALHHLPLESILIKMRDALKVNGRLAALDLFQEKGFADWLTSPLAVGVHFALNRIKNGQTRQTPEEQQAWAEHGQSDSYPTLSGVREVCRRVLPNAKVRKHLLWRYSITWTKRRK